MEVFEVLREYEILKCHGLKLPLLDFSQNDVLTVNSKGKFDRDIWINNDRFCNKQKIRQYEGYW